MTFFSAVYITDPVDWAALHAWVNRELLGLSEEARVAQVNEGDPYYYFPDDRRIRSSLENEPGQSAVWFSVDWWQEPKSFDGVTVFGQLCFSVEDEAAHEVWVSRLRDEFFVPAGVGFLVKPVDEEVEGGSDV